MSTAPSSIPPPSFDVAPELPDGVERRRPPEYPRWKPWMAWAGARRRLRRRARGCARHRRHRRRCRLELRRPPPGGEHLGDDRAGPLVRRRRVALRQPRRRGRCPSSSACARRACWPADRLDGRRVRRLLRVHARVGVDPGRQPRRHEAPRRARRQRQHLRAARGGLPRRGRRADGRGVLLPRLLLRGAAQLAGAAGRRRSSPGWSSARSTSGRPRPPSCCRWPSSASRCACCASAPARCIRASPCTARTTRSPSASPSTGGGRSSCSWSCALGIISLVMLAVRARWTPAPAPAG